MRRDAVSKPVDVAMPSHILPCAAPEDKPACLQFADSEDCDRNYTDACSNVSVQLHVPLHLRQHIKEEPVLAEFREPSKSKCSWDMPSFRERIKDVPAGINFAPDRHRHDQYMEQLDDYLEKVSKKPHKFEAEVYLKKMLSGMGLVGLDRAESVEDNKTRKRKACVFSRSTWCSRSMHIS